ncbi:MAG: DUF1638 domain-containing protein [Coriobacteriales bacterium]|jgi:hypothetical protein|nr:DUF1638 domain-containing protein [Coriobacteriales bacterium]
MKTAVFACNTLHDEITLAAQQVGFTGDMHWLASNLHNSTERLREALQCGLDSLNSYERVLLGFGFCGSSVSGLTTGSYQLILPRIDDCISLMIGSIRRRAELSEGHNSIFLTKGWLTNESNIMSEYLHSLNKYGEEAARSVIEMMYAHHDRLTLIDTGAYTVEEFLPDVIKMAAFFDKSANVVPGTLEYLEKLLTGPWTPDLFITISPQTLIDSSMLRLPD